LTPAIIPRQMKVSDLGLDERIVSILSKQGIEELYPPQAESIGAALAGKNIVLAIPTAAGKSLIAYLAAVKSVMAGGKALYIVPLRALASEKYDDLKEFDSLGIKTGLAVGDYDTPDPTLERYDIIIATSEKADSLLRHKTSWLKRLTTVVADEVHLINDGDRGPTLEVTLAKMRQVNPRAQIIALSATIRNSDELANWLGAEHFRSEWRPVPLKQGICWNDKIHFTDGSSRPVPPEGEEILALVLDTVREGGQCLIFVNTRRSTESLATSLASRLKQAIEPKEREKLAEMADDLSKRQDEPTSMVARLAKCVEGGAAFHNAGLTNDQRRMVETNFKKGRIKCIVATPTLASGINLPARRVVVRDLSRFDVTYGNAPIPVLEIKQMCGRAGRPRYDKFGEAVLIAKKEEDIKELTDAYFLSKPEAIVSKLGTEPALRVHILASIATEHTKTEQEIFDFIGSTFFAHCEDIENIRDKVVAVLSFLEREGFITAKDTLRATLFGKRTSDLYIDPLSAVKMRDHLEGELESDFAHLWAVCSTPDMPKLYLRRGDYQWVDEKIVFEGLTFPVDDYDFMMAEVKTAALLEDWMDERPENDITKRFGIGPGDIRRMTEQARWLLYSMQELARIFNKARVRPVSRLVLRETYGVKEELLPLVELRGVGRVRGRALFSRGFKTLRDLQKAEAGDIARIPSIGPAVARKIKEQLGAGEEAAKGPLIGQSGLTDFD